MAPGRTSGSRATRGRQKLLLAGTDLFRRTGYASTTVDAICEQAGVTKGAFFHHFPSKEALAVECLRGWDDMARGMDEQAPYRAIEDPVGRVYGYVDFLIATIGDPRMLKSCLAGTTVQEISSTNLPLRAAANTCFVNMEARFQALLDAACEDRGVKLDTASLASLCTATVQGSLIACKASGDGMLIVSNLKHYKAYLQTQFGDPES